MIKAIERYGQGRVFTIGPFRADYDPSDNRMTLATNDRTFAWARYVGGTRWRIQFAVGGSLRGNHVAFATDLWELAAQMEAQLVARAVHSAVTRGLLDKATLDSAAEDATTYFAVREKSTDDTKGLGWTIVRGWSETENFHRYPLERFEVRRLFFGIPMRGALVADAPKPEAPKDRPAEIQKADDDFPRVGQTSKLWLVQASAKQFVGRVHEASTLFGCVEAAESFLGSVLYGRGITSKEAERATTWLFARVRDSFGESPEFPGFVDFVHKRLACTITADGVIRGSDEPNTHEGDRVVSLGEFIAMGGSAP